MLFPNIYGIIVNHNMYSIKAAKETARIQGNVDKNVFLRCYKKLWNTTNINELQLEYNSTDYLHAFITLDELEKVLKLTKMVKPQDKITLTQSYTSRRQKGLN